MKRLNNKDNNSPEEYQKIAYTPVDWFELKRWQRLLKHWKGGYLLDLGSFDSMVPVFAKALYPESWVHALDYSYKGTNIYSGIYYDQGDVYNIKRGDATMDYVVMGQLLEHLEYPEKALKEAMRVLKVGGVLALSVPLNETEAGEVDKTHHLWSFSEQDIEELLKPYGSWEIETLRSQFIPRYIYHFPNIVAFCKKSNA